MQRIVDKACRGLPLRQKPSPLILRPRGGGADRIRLVTVYRVMQRFRAVDLARLTLEVRRELQRPLLPIAVAADLETLERMGLVRRDDEFDDDTGDQPLWQLT